MTAGAKDVLVTLQRATVTTNAHRDEVETWADLAQEYAQVFYGRGDERRQAAVEQGSQAATFRFWSSDKTRSLTLKDRLMLDGDVWDITGIAPVDRQSIEITATRSL